MTIIRREQLESLDRRKRERQHAALVEALTVDDDKSNEDPQTGDVLMVDSRGNTS